MPADRNTSTEPIQYTSVGLSRLTLDRVDRLRMCLGRSRSHVIEILLTGGGLDTVEEQYAESVEAVRRLAERRGQSWGQLVDDYVTEYSGKTYPPTVAQLLDDPEWTAKL